MSDATNSQDRQGGVASVTPARPCREARRGRPPRKLEVVHLGEYRVEKTAVELLAIEFAHWLGDRNRVSDAEH